MVLALPTGCGVRGVVVPGWRLVGLTPRYGDVIPSGYGTRWRHTLRSTVHTHTRHIHLIRHTPEGGYPAGAQSATSHRHAHEGGLSI